MDPYYTLKGIDGLPINCRYFADKMEGYFGSRIQYEPNDTAVLSRFNSVKIRE
jgi:hypothetical protein